MKLLYATSITLPSYRANRIQVVAMGKAWAAILGHDFVLGISAGAEEVKLSGENAFVVGEGRSFTLAWRYLRFARQQGVTHLYCREELMLVCMLLLNTLYFRLPLRFYYELHHLSYTQGLWRYLLLNRMAGVVSITDAMKEVLVAAGYPRTRVLVAPDAVAIDAFNPAASKAAARRELALPLGKKIILYAGDLDIPWKGARVLHEAAGEFDEEYLVVFVGSKPHHVEHFRKVNPKRENVLFVGYKPHREIPTYLAAADVLVLPNSGKYEISRIATSPMKLFEYMAALRPIVASDLPAIREVLNEKNAFLVPPDDPSVLARGIKTLLQDASRAGALAQQAREDVSPFTWENRARAVAEFLEHHA